MTVKAKRSVLSETFLDEFLSDRPNSDHHRAIFGGEMEADPWDDDRFPSECPECGMTHGGHSRSCSRAHGDGEHGEAEELTEADECPECLGMYGDHHSSCTRKGGGEFELAEADDEMDYVYADGSRSPEYDPKKKVLKYPSKTKVTDAQRSTAQGTSPSKASISLPEGLDKACSECGMVTEHEIGCSMEPERKTEGRKPMVDRGDPDQMLFERMDVLVNSRRDGSCERTYRASRPASPKKAATLAELVSSTAREILRENGLGRAKTSAPLQKFVSSIKAAQAALGDLGQTAGDPQAMAQAEWLLKATQTILRNLEKMPELTQEPWTNVNRRGVGERSPTNEADGEERDEDSMGEVDVVYEEEKMDEMKLSVAGPAFGSGRGVRDDDDDNVDSSGILRKPAAVSDEDVEDQDERYPHEHYWSELSPKEKEEVARQDAFWRDRSENPMNRADSTPAIPKKRIGPPPLPAPVPTGLSSPTVLLKKGKK